MTYLKILLPLIFLTALLMFVNRSPLFHPGGEKFRNSEADIFIKSALGVEIIALLIILVFAL